MVDLVINGTHIPHNIKALPGETAELSEAIARITSEDIAALVACPPYSESLRDGYVLAPPGMRSGNEHCFPVVGEIAAGSGIVSRLRPGTACRIFTGAVIPEGGVRVVPQEECCEAHGEVRVSAAAMASAQLFINRTGSEIVAGEMVVGKGTLLEIDHLALLAEAGVRHVKVVSRPRVACYCTGSELVAIGGQLEIGQKLSLNSLLLKNLIPRYGGEVAEQSIILDNKSATEGIFASLKAGKYDLVISTGGMGPGKYDLVKNAFCRAGGTIILQTLAMQPGRSVLLGTLENTIFIALPGPPHAVRTLINELVGPVLLVLQGATRYLPLALNAGLAHDYWARKTDFLQVKGGVLTVEEGTCTVRLAKRLEPITCYILFPAGRNDFKKGDVVEVHLLQAGEGGAIHL